MARRGLSANAWATKAGVNEATIRNFLAGRHASLNDSTYRKLADAADTTVGELLGETIPLDFIRVVGAVQAGVWNEALEWPENDWYSAPVAADRRFNRIRQYGLEVRGPSMNELYPDGAVVICVSLIDIGRQPRPGERVVVQRRSAAGIEATIKELRVDADNQIWLWPRSNDPNFQQPWRVPASLAGALDGDDGDEIAVVGIVIGSYRPEG